MSTGWVVQFLISIRHGKPSQVGYVASGFWGGLTVGRVILAEFTNKMGERRMIFIYIILGLAMQLLFWFVPNVIANAVAISLLGELTFYLFSFPHFKTQSYNLFTIGFFIAPMFPVGISVLTKLLPAELHVASIGEDPQISISFS